MSKKDGFTAPQWEEEGYQSFREGAGFVKPAEKVTDRTQKKTNTAPTGGISDWWVKESTGSFGHASNPSESMGQFTYRVGKDNRIYLKKGGTVDDWYPVGEEYGTAFVPLPDFNY